MAIALGMLMETGSRHTQPLAQHMEVLMFPQVLGWHHSPCSAALESRTCAALSLQGTRLSSNACLGSSASGSSLGSWGPRVPGSPHS